MYLVPKKIVSRVQPQTTNVRVLDRSGSDDENVQEDEDIEEAD